MGNLLYGIENVSLLDSWSINHFFSGLALGIILFLLKTRLPNFRKSHYFVLGLLALLAWEVFEIILSIIDKNYPGLAQTLKIYLPRAWFAEESLLNITSDLLLGLAGLAVVFFFGKNNLRP